MRVLLIKTSSLGDIIHTLPALTDAKKVYPTIEFDWVVEESFAEIPAWHPAVRQVIPVALRRWRKQFPLSFFSQEFKTFIKTLRQTHYDYVLDAQGLIKSAFITRLAKGTRCGLNWQSAWEPLASLVYEKKAAVNPDQHAIDRVRQLFSATLNYPLSPTTSDYNLEKIPRINASFSYLIEQNFLVFLHGTTWESKHWPELYWNNLINLLEKTGLTILLPWGNAAEKERADRLASGKNFVVVLPKLNLGELAGFLARAKGVVAVDTGLAHLAAALNVPSVSIYGATNPQLTGTRGTKQLHLKADSPWCTPCLKSKCFYTGESIVKPACYDNLTPEKVWQLLRTQI